MKFYVVYSEFPIPGDGIIGEPFLTRNGAVIDVEKVELFFSDKTTMVIQARCETIGPIHINDPEMELKEILIHAQPISDDINCSNVLNCIKNQQLTTDKCNQHIR